MHSTVAILIIALVATATAFTPRRSLPPGISPRVQQHRLIACAVSTNGTDPSLSAAVQRDQVALWSASDTVVNSGLFLLLHTFTWSSAQFAGFNPFNTADRAAFALARLVGIGAFVAVQQVAAGGISFDGWLAGDDDEHGLGRVEGSYNPIAFSAGAAVAFVALCITSSASYAMLVQGTGLPEALTTWLPGARALEPGRAFDLLVAAPVQEEIFFRAWLINALQKTGVGELGTLAASSVAFMLWQCAGLLSPPRPPPVPQP